MGLERRIRSRTLRRELPFPQPYLQPETKAKHLRDKANPTKIVGEFTTIGVFSGGIVGLVVGGIYLIAKGIETGNPSVIFDAAVSVVPLTDFAGIIVGGTLGFMAARAYLALSTR